MNASDATGASVSVVVTCYNYGHFLDACLDSLEAQTQRAEQVIVVDDGSTDASRSVLRARRETLTIVEKENGGQASAFNAGFAAATGDIVVFLDADDTLAPDALEAIRIAWHDRLAAVSFRLNLIDAAGRYCGFYPVEPREGDMRPELLSRGYFAFLPTSANAFNRRLIAPAFPLPEPRWRISADTVLVRAAALAGQIRQLPFALGSYRVHGGNSYYRASLPRTQFLQRGTRDVADSCLALARMPSGAAVLGPDPDAVRLDLLLASLRARLSLVDFGDHKPQVLQAVGSALKLLLKLRLGLRARVFYGFCLLLLPISLRLVPQSRRWVVTPEEMPRLLGRVLSRARGRGPAKRRRAACRSRWPAVATAGSFTPQSGHEAASWFNTFDWRPRRSDGGRVLCSSTGEITLPLAYLPGGATLSLELEAVGPYARMPLDVSFAISGQVVGQARILGRGRLSAILEPALTLPECPLQLELAVSPRPSSLADRWTLLTAPAGMLEATEVEIAPPDPATTGFLLGVGEQRAFAEIARACQVSPPVDADHPDRVEGSELVLCLIRSDLAEATELVVRFQEEQIAGSLVATDQSGPIYRGRIGESSVIRIPIARRRSPDDSELVLTLSLDPDDPFEAPEFLLSSIGVAGPGSDFEIYPPVNFPLFGPGAIWRFEEEADETANALGEGWTRGEAGAELFDTLGVLRFTVDPATADDAVLHMRLAPLASVPDEATPAVSAALPDLAPALRDDAASHMRPVPVPPPEQAPLAVAVTAGDEVLAQILLEGEHDLAVPLGGVLAKGGRRIELAVHAALPVGDGPDVELDRGGLALKSLQLSSEALQPSAPQPTSAARSRTLGADMEAAAELAKRLRLPGARPEPSAPAEFVSLHRGIVAAIRTLASSAVLPLLLNEETLGRLCDIGEAAAEAGENLDALRSDADRAGLFLTDPVEAVRSAAIAILTAPPWQALAGHRPDDLPEALRAFPSELARYLCSLSNEVATADDLASFHRHAAALLTYARARFALEARGSRGEKLAEEILRQFKPLPALFGGGSLRDIGRALGAAIETFLVARGRRITWTGPNRESSHRPRLGVLIRDLRAAPETWILTGTVGALPADAFDVTVFVTGQETEASSLSAKVVDVGGIGVDRAVEIIRAAQLDILLLGSFFNSYENIAAIAAHRLAPVQIATTAVSAMTTGMKSFDAMLSTSLWEPREAAAHYTERLYLAGAPVQRFDLGDGAGGRAPKRAAERERLGLPADAVVLTSGAMLLKIGRELMETWVDILAAAPEALLLLYPFAANWRTNLSAAGRFERRVREACTAKGVDPTRVRILDSIDHSEVERILRISDVYLDSFPYAGATTVVEALRAGLPGVALAGDSQRGLQGAAWLRMCGLGRLVAETPADYVRIASELANDADARAAAAASIRWPASLEAEAFGQRFAAILTELARRSPAASDPALPSDAA